jgi:hypothetical protein
MAIVESDTLKQEFGCLKSVTRLESKYGKSKSEFFDLKFWFVHYVELIYLNILKYMISFTEFRVLEQDRVDICILRWHDSNMCKSTARQGNQKLDQ